MAWTDFVKFVRQLSHDIRNHLNALELQAVFINELSKDSEMETEIRRLRETISEVTSGLQKLSTALTEPKPNRIPYPAADLMNDLKAKFEKGFPEHQARVKWEIDPAATPIDVDPQLLQEAMLELLGNAFRFSPQNAGFAVVSRSTAAGLELTLREPKQEFNQATSDWGRQPLTTVGHAHYGLGLNRVRAIIAAHQGTFQAKYDHDGASLITTIILPLAPSGT